MALPVPSLALPEDVHDRVAHAPRAANRGALLIARGELLRITDPRGEQVSDLISFARADTGEWLSSGRTIDYANTIYVTTGHTLYSNRSRPMWTIVEDTVGRHDFLLTPCSPDTFRILYGTTAIIRAASRISCRHSRRSASRPTRSRRRSTSS